MVMAKKNANNSIPGIKLKVLKVSREKFGIKIHDATKFVYLLLIFTYFDEKRLNPIIINATLMDINKFKMIENKTLRIAKKIPDIIVK